MMMFLSRKHIAYQDNGKELTLVTISVASQSELPSGGVYENMVFAQGSSAWDINSGEWFGLVNGNWVKQPQPLDFGFYEGA